MLDLAIVGGRAVLPSGIEDADIGIQDGQIAIIGRQGQLPAARTTIVATDQLVMPGAIDVHFHCRAPAHPAGVFAWTGLRDLQKRGDFSQNWSKSLTLERVNRRGPLDFPKSLAHLGFLHP